MWAFQGLRGRLLRELVREGRGARDWREEVGPGTQGLSFLKKAPKEIKLTKKRKCRICRKGTKGANSEAWNVQFGPRSPTLSLLPGFWAWRKNTDEEKAALEGKEMSAGESLSSQMLEEMPLERVKKLNVRVSPSPLP